MKVKFILLFLLTVLFLPSQLLAEENWTSIKVSLFPDLEIPHQRNVQGLSIGLGNWTEKTKGVQIGITNLQLQGFNGNNGNGNGNGETSNMEGIQIGFYNIARNVKGLQIGVVNGCYNLKGVQIGIINIMTKRVWPVYPLFNISFSYH
ncbi:MAG: hypothetical protein FJ241_12065 [Nitrospira sp.]|nr:hypothetical protein [Nitrospira sp.]